MIEEVWLLALAQWQELRALVVRRLGCDEQTAEETLWNAFGTAFTRWKAKPRSPILNPGAFMWHIAHLAVVNEIRQRTRERKRSQRLRLHWEEVAARKRTEDPSDQVSYEDLKGRCFREIYRVVPRRHRPVFLRFLECESCEEVAAEFDMPEGTVRSIVSRSRKLLREVLCPHQKAES